MPYRDIQNTNQASSPKYVTSQSKREEFLDMAATMFAELFYAQYRDMEKKRLSRPDSKSSGQ
jgi:hypothetical protein